MNFRMRFLWLAAATCLLHAGFVSSSNDNEINDNEINDNEINDNDDQDEEEYWTDHGRYLESTKIDFASVDLTGDPQQAANLAVQALTSDLQGRLSKLFETAVTPECRALIAQHYGYFTKALADEGPFPFSDVRFDNTCEGDIEYDWDDLPPGVNMGTIQNRTYQPPRDEAEYITSDEIVLVYGILAHDSAEATIRLMEAVEEPTTTFVVHIDSKYQETYEKVKEYASKRERVHVLDHPRRVSISWGGFSMVNATLQILEYIDDFNFTHFVHMASTAYPIASNRRIRNTLAQYPTDANFVHVILKPVRPGFNRWHYFVECDDRLHRIHRLPPLKAETHGADMYTASQWFIISKEFAHYLANPEPGGFLYQYLEYIQHVVVADETFFGTVLRNTPFCHKHHNWNFLHLQFDRWENERSLEMRDERKCVMHDPNHCGRSPTTITLDYLDILELSEDLFARKFLDDVDPQVKNVVDTLRRNEEMILTTLGADKPIPRSEKVNMKFEGLGVLFVAKDTVNETEPLCLGLGERLNLVRLVPCFEEGIVATLAPGWETGAVDTNETMVHIRWEVAPCSSDGNLERSESGEINVTSGLFVPTGPRCMFRMLDGPRIGRCLDGESLDSQPGGLVHVFPCTKRWHQYLSFGNGKEVPAGAIHTTVPMHTRKRIAETGREQDAYMCLGVAGRGDLDEEDWLGQRGGDDGDMDDDEEEETDELDDADEDTVTTDEEEVGGLRPLRFWENEQLIATRCSNVGAVIEWIVVPFIYEEAPEPLDGEEDEL